jgi:hypothetical protein
VLLAWLTTLPKRGALPQIAHFNAMTTHFLLFKG